METSCAARMRLRSRLEVVESVGSEWLAWIARIVLRILIFKIVGIFISLVNFFN
jgi:hypothetical protein